MSITYAQKQVPAQKKEAPGAVSIHDSSLQGEALQRKEDLVNGIVQRIETPRPNNTGMPDNLKSGIESLSGYSMDNVRVHYNSSKPATVQALAYTQGTDIHVAPGQEKHLPHEAWHVAQQMAGRVAPTTNINGMPVNDNAALEHEADVMGEKAVTQRRETSGLNEASIGEEVCQRTQITYKPMEIEVRGVTGKITVGHITNAILTPGQPVHGTAPDNSQNELMDAIKPNGSSKNPYIKGHLLNHHLGGLGIAANMIPITDKANKLHEMFVEEGVKNLVYANQIVCNHNDSKNQLLQNLLSANTTRRFTRFRDDTIRMEAKRISERTNPIAERLDENIIDGKKPVTYNVEANIINDRAIDKANPPEVLLSCSVQYGLGGESLNAIVHSGPKPWQAEVEGNITNQINNFLSHHSSSESSYLRPSSQDLKDVGWGGLSYSPKSYVTGEPRGADLINSNLINDDGTFRCTIQGADSKTNSNLEKIFPEVMKPINTLREGVNNSFIMKQPIDPTALQSHLELIKQTILSLNYYIAQAMLRPGVLRSGRSFRQW